MSSSETSWNVVVGNTSEEIRQPQPPAQAPTFTFSNGQRGHPAPAPQILAVDEGQETIIQQVEGANKTLFMSSSSQLKKLEAILGRARSSIREAANVRNKTSTHEDPDYVPRGPRYRNPNAFHRGRLQMPLSPIYSTSLFRFCAMLILPKDLIPLKMSRFQKLSF